jgi:hypothetical protein
LTLAFGTLVVRVRDISEGGALLAMSRSPAVGAPGVLLFEAFDERPTLACTVRHVAERWRQVGVEFTGDKQRAARVAGEVVRRVTAETIAKAGAAGRIG